MIVLMAPSVQADEPSRFTEPGNEYRVLQVDEPGKIVLDLSVNDGMVELILLNETNWQRYEDDDPDYEALHRSHSYLYRQPHPQSSLGRGTRHLPSDLHRQWEPDRLRVFALVRVVRRI